MTPTKSIRPSRILTLILVWSLIGCSTGSVGLVRPDLVDTSSSRTSHQEAEYIPSKPDPISQADPTTDATVELTASQTDALVTTGPPPKPADPARKAILSRPDDRARGYPWLMTDDGLRKAVGSALQLRAARSRLSTAQSNVRNLKAALEMSRIEYRTSPWVWVGLGVALALIPVGIGVGFYLGSK